MYTYRESYLNDVLDIPTGNIFTIDQLDHKFMHNIHPD